MNGNDQKILSKKERRELKRKEKEAFMQKEKTKKMIKKIVSYFFIGLIIIVFLSFLFKGEKNSGSSISQIEIKPNDLIKGNKEAKVVLIEYSDFQCPACAFFFPIVKRLFEEYKDKIVFVYRHFPLPQHKNAKLAAIASEAAARQEKFWEMHDKLFENQKFWGEEKNAKDIFIKYAQDLGLDLEKFKSDLNSKEIADKVESDFQGGLSLKVNATPSFFLNGRYLNPSKVEISSEEKFRALLKAEIEKMDSANEKQDSLNNLQNTDNKTK